MNPEPTTSTTAADTNTATATKDAEDRGGGDTSWRNDATVMTNGHSYSTFQNGTKEGDGQVNPADSTYSLQEAIDKMGFGAYQLRLSVVLGISYISDSMEVMLLSVLSPVLKCEFHLNAGEQSILTIVVFMGMLVSANFWGNIGDRYGRKKSLLMSTAVCGYFGILTSLSPSYLWVVLNRSLVAMGLGGFPQLFTLYSELIPTKSRSYCIVLIGVIWACGACFEVLLAMVTLPYLGWRWYLVFTAFPVIVAFILLCNIPESPRYLMTNGKHEETVAILKKIAKVNGNILPEGSLCYQEKVQDQGKIKDLFCPKFLRTTLLLGIIMAASNMSYYGTTLLTTSLFEKYDGCHGYTSHGKSHQDVSCRSLCTSLTHDDYMDLFLTSLGDLPGLFICVGLMSKLGRIPALTIIMAVYTVLMAVCNICAPRLVLVALIFGARAMGLGSSQGVYVYITEVYPTSIRGMGMGWCVTTKSFGVVVAALLSQVLIDYSAYMGISSYAAIGLIGTISTWLLPYETKNKRLTDSVSENIY